MEVHRKSGRAISRSTTGVFAETVNAAGSALRYLQNAGNVSTAQLGEGSGNFQLRGLSAGESTVPIGLWGNFSYFSSENDATGEQSDASGWHGSFGADVAITESAFLGLSVGYERDDTDTLFNAGNAKSTGLTVAAYLGVIMSEHLSADVAFGRSFLDTDQYRTSGGARVTSEMDGTRTFVAGNLNYHRQWGKWSTTSRGGFLWLSDTQEAFTESNGSAVAESRFNLGRARLSAEIGRTMGSFEPYVNATFSHTLSQSTTPAFLPTRDRSDLLLGVGVRYFAAETLSGYFEFTTLLGRRNVEERTATFLIRADF